MNLKKFITYTFIGSLPWCFALGYFGIKLGQNWGIIEGYFHILDIIIEIGILGIILYLIYKYAGKSKLTILKEGDKMRSRYSMLLGAGIVISLFFLVTLVNSSNATYLTYIFAGILLVGGYIATYTSNIKKSRVALIGRAGSIYIINCLSVIY